MISYKVLGKEYDPSVTVTITLPRSKWAALAMCFGNINILNFTNHNKELQHAVQYKTATGRSFLTLFLYQLCKEAAK